MGVVTLLLTVPEWDMSVASVAGVLLGTAGAFMLCGFLLWVPAGVWIGVQVEILPRLGRGAAFAVLGVLLGGMLSGGLVLVSGNASWPESLGVVGQSATAAGVSSVLGWGLAEMQRRRPPSSAGT